MFGNECLGELQYEATTAAIVMAGLFLSFLVEYLGYRAVKWQARRKAGSAVPTAEGLKSIEMVSIYVMEAGVIFHSLSTSLPPYQTTEPRLEHTLTSTHSHRRHPGRSRR
jgi:zinc transporter 1/2/3